MPQLEIRHRFPISDLCCRFTIWNWTIWNPDFNDFGQNGGHLPWFQIVGLADFRFHLKSGTFATQPLLNHLKSRLVWISDPHCTKNIATFVVFRYPVTISVKDFTNPDNLTLDLFSTRWFLTWFFFSIGTITTYVCDSRSLSLSDLSGTHQREPSTRPLAIQHLDNRLYLSPCKLSKGGR